MACFSVFGNVGCHLNSNVALAIELCFSVLISNCKITCQRYKRVRVSVFIERNNCWMIIQLELIDWIVHLYQDVTSYNTITLQCVQNNPWPTCSNTTQGFQQILKLHLTKQAVLHVCGSILEKFEDSLFYPLYNIIKGQLLNFCTKWWIFSKWSSWMSVLLKVIEIFFFN